MKSAILNDGTQYYEELSKKYIKHDKGLFILAPSGVGKTHFCTRQKEPHWIDGDYLWETAGAHPPVEEAWWNFPLDELLRVEKRSDVITMEAMSEGYWILGASNYWLQPSAIVIPDWETHVKYIKHREENNYDGGLKSHQLEQLKRHITIITKWHTEYNVPKFDSIQEAVEYLTKDS